MLGHAGADVEAYTTTLPRAGEFVRMVRRVLAQWSADSCGRPQHQDTNDASRLIDSRCATT